MKSDTCHATCRPLVGAIRWDAWAGVDIAKIVTKTLSPSEHRFRLPWFATVNERDEVHINGGAPGIMEQEIRYAAEAGLGFWAFCEYAEDAELSIPLNQYLTSALKDRIGFCMILHSCMSVDDAVWPKELARQIRLLKEPTQVRVLGDRPLVFTFRTDATDERIGSRVADFRAAARAAGIPNPYMAFMGWEPVYDWNRARRLGFDCVSAYAFGYMVHEGLSRPFAKHAGTTEKEQWAVFSENKIPSIPLINTGWDKRPRMDNPVPWEMGDSYHHDKRYIETATPAEIAVHASRCVEWMKQNASINPSHAAICYAWNENDEGGWLIPTRNEDGSVNTGRLDALRNVLR